MDSEQVLKRRRETRDRVRKYRALRKQLIDIFNHPEPESSEAEEMGAACCGESDPESFDSPNERQSRGRRRRRRSQHRSPHRAVQKGANKCETRSQDPRHYELIILGLPEGTGHTPDVSARLMAAALGTSIAAGDITRVYRIPGKVGRPQPLIIKFKSVELRDKWIALKRKKKDLFANQVHHTFKDQKISVMETLTSEERELLGKVHQFSRWNHYEHVWVKHGEIYLRKTDGAVVRHIQCNEDLENIRD